MKLLYMIAFVIISKFSFSQATETEDNEEELPEWVYCGESKGDKKF